MSTQISNERVLADIKRTEYYLTGYLEKFWNLIKISPEKWKDGTLDSEYSFWVVAIWGHFVLLYNDIEEGYNISNYANHGTIERPGSNQSDLYEMIESISKMFSPVKG